MITLTKSEKIYMNIKDIAKEIRQKLKKSYPKCTFSIKISRYSMGQSLKISLMKAPFDAFKGDFDVNGNRIMDQYSHEYNFDESDSMTDYFHVNFYLHVAIGKEG